MSPASVAACAIKGCLCDVRDFLDHDAGEQIGN